MPKTKTKTEEAAPVSPGAPSEIDKLLSRQKYLQDLIETLQTEGIRSLSDAELKLSFVNEELRKLGH